MEKITLNKNSKLKKVLNHNFSTIALFRCTSKKHAEELKKGRFRFNLPESWIKEEENGNLGLGDSLEGVFLSTKINDNSSFINNL